MERTIEVEVTLTPQEFEKVVRQQIISSYVKVAGGWLGIVVGVIVLTLLISFGPFKGEDRTFVGLSILFGLLVAPFVTYFKQFSAAKKAFLASPLSGSIKYIFSPNNYQVTTEQTHQTGQWNTVRSYKLTSDMLVLYTGTNTVLLVPARAFAFYNDYQTLLQFVEQNFEEQRA